MGSRTFVEALRLSPRKKRAKHGVFSPPNIGGFAWEEPTPLLGGDWEGQKTTYGRSPKKPTVGRLTDLPWVAKTTHSRFYLGPFRRAKQSERDRSPSRLKTVLLERLIPLHWKSWEREGRYSIYKEETPQHIIGSPLTLSQTKGKGEGTWSLTEALRANYSARM